MKFFKVTKEEDARKTVGDALEKVALATERINLSEACSSCLAEDVFSGEKYPAYNRSTVDGYALDARDAYCASPSVPALLRYKGKIAIGEDASVVVNRGECAAVATGSVMPDGADAVVMIENAGEFGDDIAVYAPVAAGANVVKKGEELDKGSLIATRGKTVTPLLQGVFACVGINKIRVYKKIRAAIISTGNELVDVSQKAEHGKIRDVNTRLLTASCERDGFEVSYTARVSDDENAIKKAIKEASESCDLILISGGSSVGAKDLTEKVLSEGEIILHGLAMKPGKPTIIAKIHGALAVGLPGNPLAALMVYEEIIAGAVRNVRGMVKHKFFARAETNFASVPGRTTLQLVRAYFDGESYVAQPVFLKSANLVTALKATGYVKISPDTEGINKGEMLEVIPFGL